MKKQLRNIRLTLPKGIVYDVLEVGRKLHGAPSLSKYIMTAALSYTKNYIEEKQSELDKRKEEAATDNGLRNSTGETIGETGGDERSDNGTSSEPGTVPSTGDNGDEPTS